VSKHIIRMQVNGEPYELAVDANRTLLDILRNDIGLTGTKRGCDVGDCGACTVLLTPPGETRGKAVNSCLVLGVEADGAQVRTVEGLAIQTPEGPRLHPLQAKFLELGAAQCGFCTPGMLMSAVALLEASPHPTEDEVKFAISGNLCRCTGYVKIVDAILAASWDAPADLAGGA
jgi:aerobic carbon-monoxide dehydrogenase small subunit